MTYNKELILTTEASIILPHFSENGELHSKYMDGDDYRLVPMKPTDLIDLNLRMTGTSLKGAVEGARNLLGSGTMAPVVICRKHAMYWIPVTSSKLPECIWVAVSHVRKYVANGRGGVRVYLKNGSVVNLACSYYTFHNRMLRAYSLRCQVESHAEEVRKANGIYKKTYLICKEAGVNYDWKEGKTQEPN